MNQLAVVISLVGFTLDVFTICCSFSTRLL